jgi:hypothetical protein
MYLVKRLLPFVLTFVLGLLIASFFVTVTMPHFSCYKYKRSYDQRSYYCPQQQERERRREIERRLREDFDEMNDDEITLPAIPPPPPVAPVQPRGTVHR